jgi:hypothetical protein
VALFFLGLQAYAFFYPAGGWNQNVRFALVRAIADEGRLTIDSYAGDTGDLARRGRHFYCDKAPGTSLLGVPAYWLARRAGATVDTAAHATTVWAVAVPAAAALVAVFRTSRMLGLTTTMATLLSVAYGFGTLAFPYATLLNGHQLCASLLAGAFGLMARPAPSPRSYAGAGLLMGAAVAVEYQAVLAVAILAGYMAAKGVPRRGWAAAAMGIALPIAGLLTYHAAAFGSPFRTGYSFSTQEHRAMGAFMGIGAPSGAALVNLLLSPTRGLLYSAPWLVLGAWGAARLLRDERRREGVVCVAIPLAYLALSVSLVDWDGGWAIGPRYLVPALPFLALGAAGAGRARGAVPAGATVIGVAAAYSIAMMLAATAVQPEVNTLAYPRPFADRLLPALAAGRVALNTQSIEDLYPDGGAPDAWNLGQKMGFAGLTSLLPLALSTSLVGALLFRTARRADRRADANA